MCLCVFTSVVGIRKSVNPFPHEIKVAFINKTGMDDGWNQKADMGACGEVATVNHYLIFVLLT